MLWKNEKTCLVVVEKMMLLKSLLVTMEGLVKKTVHQNDILSDSTLNVNVKNSLATMTWLVQS